MTITAGADADALDRLAAKIDQEAVHLEEIYGPVRRSLRSSGWQGPDADQFASEWDGPSKARLTNTAAALRGAAKTLRKNAREQRRASETGYPGVHGQIPVVSGVGVGGSKSALSLEQLMSLIASGTFTIADLMELPTGGIKQIVEFAKSGRIFGTVDKFGLGLSAVFGSLSYLAAGQESGYTSQRGVHAGFDAIGGTVSAAAGGALGSLAWTASTVVGGLIGPPLIRGVDDVTRLATGSDLGYLNTMWLMRTYHVTNLDQLPADIRFQATSDMTKATTGWSGAWNMAQSASPVGMLHSLGSALL